MSAAQAAGTRSREGDVGLRINHHSMKIRLNFRRETRERINRENGSNGFVSNFFFFLFFFFPFLLESRRKLHPCIFLSFFFTPNFSFSPTF